MDKTAGKFVTPQDYARLTSERLYSRKGWLLLVPCAAGIGMCKKIAGYYDKNLIEAGVKDKPVPVAYGEFREGSVNRRFIDGELQTRLPFHVGGSAAFVIQCLHNKQLPGSVNDNLMDLKITGRALKVSGASHITAVLPYMAYDRGDKPTYMKREPVTAKMVADELKVAGCFDTVITYHPHAEAIRGFFEPDIRFIPLNGLDLAISILWEYMNRDDVIAIAPDVGSGTTARHLADGLKIGLAITDKNRKANGDLDSMGILGNLNGKKIGVGIEDETVTIETLYNASKWYHKAGLEKLIWIVSHLKADEKMINEKGKIIHPIEMLNEMHTSLNVELVCVTDSIPQTEAFRSLSFLNEYSIAERLMMAINHLFYEVPTSGPFWPNVEKPMFHDVPTNK